MNAAALLNDDLEHIAQHGRDLWEDLRGKRIFVTGGTGFFGRWLLESFAHVNRARRLEARMVVLSRNPQEFQTRVPHLGEEAGIRFLAGDVRALTATALGEERFDFLIHAATEASARLNTDEPLRMFETVVQGTRAALDFAIATRARRFLLTSSGAVYGPQPSEMTHLSEDFRGGPDPTSPGSAYAEGKRAAELLCACYAKAHGLEPLIARGFAFVGPFLPLDAHFAIGNFIGDALTGGPIRVQGDGTPYRSYLYAADLAIWLWTILLRGEALRPYNVGSSRDLTIAQLAETVRLTLDEKLEIAIAQKPAASGAVLRYVPGNARAEKELGLREWIDLEEAIRRTATHARQAS